MRWSHGSPAATIGGMSRAPGALSVLVRVVGGFVALVVLVYLAVNLASMARGWQQRGELADEFAASAEPRLPDLRDRRAAVSAEVGREPDRAWVEQVCSFGSDDSGWMVNNYRERCALRAVSAWQVETPDAGRRLLRVAPPDHTVDQPGCEQLGTLGRSGAPGRTSDPTVEVFLASAARDPEDPCGAGQPYGSRARAVEGEVEELPLDATWLVVVDDSGDLVDEDIGCAHWSVIFCDNPFTDHAWADLG